MTTGAGRRGVQNSMVALYGVMVRPTTTLCHILHNPETYLASSVAIFAAIVVLGVLFPSNSVIGQTDETVWDGALYAGVTGSARVLLVILGIFWIGKVWGGSRSLRRAFPVLAYCLVPITLWIVADPAVRSLLTLAGPEAVLSDGLTEGYVIAYRIIQSAFSLLFVGWAFLLHVKAIRILNGFGYVRSIVIVVLAVLIESAASGMVLHVGEGLFFVP